MCSTLRRDNCTAFSRDLHKHNDEESIRSRVKQINYEAILENRKCV
jgi:hypothetical protein